MIWTVFFVGLVLSVFGALSSTALVSVSRLELTRVVSRRLRGGPGSMGWLSEIEQYLAVTAATTAFGAILLGAATPALFTGFRLVVLSLLVVLVAVPFVLFSGYLVPRWLARPYADSLRHVVVPVLRPWARVLRAVLPARAAARPIQLRSLWREGGAAGLAADDELIMVGGVMTFSERTVREVMTPRTEVVAIAEDATIEEIGQVFAQSGYSRIPVYRGTLDEIVGMLHAFDLFKLKQGEPLPVRPVAMAPASRHCGDLLLEMQRERRHLAVVLDEFGGTLGMVSLEDLLEELVGEIFDEHDDGAPGIVSAAPTVFEADGSTPLTAIEAHFEVALPPARTSTIGGLLAELAGRIPVAGERLMVRTLEFDIIASSPTRVERVLIRPGPVTPALLAPPVTGGKQP
ncbi:MAG: hemolysin family protein [Gemmatimonadota bacterium]